MIKSIKSIKKNTEFVQKLIDFYDQIDSLTYKEKPKYN